MIHRKGTLDQRSDSRNQRTELVHEFIIQLADLAADRYGADCELARWAREAEQRLKKRSRAASA